MPEYLLLIIGIAVVLVGGALTFVTTRVRGRGRSPPPAPPRTTADAPPRVEDDDGAAARPHRPSRTSRPPLEKPESSASRLVRLRQRLARSQSPLGRGLLALLSRDVIDEDTWEEIEDTLITADVGVKPRPGAGRPAAHPGEGGGQLVGVDQGHRARRAGHDRRPERWTGRWPSSRRDGKPAVVLMVGVNGTGKTTTVGKLARVLVAEDKQVVLGAADTFRAAASEQLTTWGERVGVPTVRGPEGGDPASVAFEAVRRGIETEADVVVVDTAGRLQNKAGLMDELGKVKRVIEKQTPGLGGAARARCDHRAERPAAGPRLP